MNCTSPYYKYKEKACPFGPSRMPTQRQILFFSSVLSKEQTPNVIQTIQISYQHLAHPNKAPCHLSSWHNFSFSLQTKLQQVEEISLVICYLEQPIHKGLQEQVIQTAFKRQRSTQYLIKRLICIITCFLFSKEDSQRNSFFGYF